MAKTTTPIKFQLIFSDDTTAETNTVDVDVNDGAPGTNGKDGISVTGAAIQGDPTVADGYTSNTVRFTFSNSTNADVIIKVKNGDKGDKGDAGTNPSPADLISTDSGNQLKTGTDGKLLVPAGA